MAEKHTGQQMNEAAAAVIESAKEEQKKLKLAIMQELIEHVNQICRENQLKYFASGKLLTHALADKDLFPEAHDYLIIMMRQDYDVFMEKIAAKARDWDLKIQRMYRDAGEIRDERQMHTFLRADRSVKRAGEYVRYYVKLRIDPYEYLPDSLPERKAYLKDLGRENARFRALSSEFVQKRDSRKGLVDKLRHKLRSASMKKEHNEFRETLHRYGNEKNPLYAARVELIMYAEHKTEDFLPLRKISFLGTELYIPSHPEAFQTLGKKETEQQIMDRKVRVLKIFDQVCADNSIPYVSMGQLVSSAVHVHDYEEATKLREWRVGLWRPDYEKVIQILDAQQESLDIRLCDDVEDYPSIHAHRLCLMTADDGKKTPGEHRNALAIFPLDSLPEQYAQANEFVGEMVKAADRYYRLVQAEKGEKRTPDLEGKDSQTEYERFQRERQKYNVDEAVSRKVFTIVDHMVRVFYRKELFPGQRISFRDFEISVPANPYLWHEPKDNAFAEYVAEAREQVLKKLDCLAQENKISYFAISNLLIGAAVYHDYVPDVNDRAYDLAILRPDYERMLTCLRESGAAYGLQLNEYLDEKGEIPLMKKTVSLPGDDGTVRTVSILPMDKVPEDPFLYRGFIADIKERNRMYEELLGEKTYEGKLDMPKSFLEQLQKQTMRGGNAWRVGQEEKEKGRADGSVSLRTLAEEIDRLAQVFNDDDRTHTWSRVSMGRSKNISESELFPLRRLPFRGISISVPNDYSVWQPIMDKALDRQVHAVQKADLILLREFDRVCRKLKIGYFICGGTMLGYMRNGGFIPWDDDIDIAMLRADYDRFLAEAQAELGEKFFLQTRETDPRIPYLFSKVRMNGTEYVTSYSDSRDYHKGICLDLFPFDYLPDKPEKCDGYIQEVLALAGAHNDVAIHQFTDEPSKIIPRNELEEKYLEEQKNLLETYWKTDLQTTQQAYLAAATRYNAEAEEKGYTVVASFVPSFTYIDLGDLLPYQRGMFEDVEVSVPKRPDVFLTMQYGDYMKLPPKHQQISHRLVRWATWEERSEDSEKEGAEEKA